MRRLFFDIETGFNLCAVWKTGYNITVPHEAIIKEAGIICIAYKWEGQNKVYHLEWDKNQDDKTMLQKFVKIAEQADELVAHNGDNFDIKWVRTRCYYHQIPVMPYFTTIDTLKAARSNFRFNSNKLDYIHKYSGGVGKNHTSFDLWKDIVMKKSTKAMKIMTDYCKQDVVILEDTYQKMRPYLKPKSSIAEYKCDCSHCGSSNIRVKSYKVSAAGVKYVQVQCFDCGQYQKVNAKSFGNSMKQKAVDISKRKK
nr:ribonuclease H-like domain-containing protein [uncultured Flavobacterium sp.]